MYQVYQKVGTNWKEVKIFNTAKECESWILLQKKGNFFKYDLIIEGKA